MIQVNSLRLNTNILSLGSLLGSSGQQDLINNINARSGGGSFFGSINDPFRTGFQTFMNTVIEPIRQSRDILAQTVNNLMLPDQFRPITSMEELKKGVPPCMQLPIVYYAPIRQMLEEERIDGFGIDPSTLEEEDPYASLISSGHVEIHSSTLDKDGNIEIAWMQKTTDPDLSIREIDILAMTREYIDEFRRADETKHLDFTDFPSLHC